MVPGDDETTGLGLLTNWSAFNLRNFTGTFSNIRDVILRDNSWVSRTADFSGALGFGAGKINHIYFYNAIDTTSPTANPTTTAIYSLGNSAPYSLYRSDTAASFTTSSDPNDLCFLTIKNRLFVAGNGITPIIATRYPTQTNYSWGKAGPTSDLSYTAYTQLTVAPTKVFFQATNGGTTAGTPTITAAAGTPYTASTTWDGKTVIFDNSETYTISTSTTTVLTLTTNAANTKATKNVEVHYGNLSWDTVPPKYAYAYYNPTTGHVTAASPVLQLTEQNMANVNVAVNNIIGTGDSNYTKIILFRTARNGGVLYPLKLDSAHGGSATVDANGLITNNVGTFSYWDAQPDTKLGAVIGLFDSSTLILNQPAPSDIKFMEYWSGRVWCNTLSQPWRLQFTGDSRQIPLGVAEESWPATNFRDIPANDGQITGMRVVGGTLLVCTNKAIYYVSGNNEGDYTLVRLSSRGQGVNYFAIDEHPGDSTEESASAIYVSSDNRMWRHFPGGKVVDIGWPIQDKLDAVQRTGTNRPFLVKVTPLNKNWICVLAIRNQANTGYVTFFYDFDTKAWYDWGYGAIGSSTIANAVGAGYNYAQNKTSVYGGSNSAPTIYLIQDDTTASGLQATWTSQALDFGSRRAKKTIESINVYVSDDTLSGWQVQVQYDQAGGFVAFTKDTISGSPRYRGPGVMMFSTPSPKQFHSAEIKLIWGTTTGTPPKVYRVEVVYHPESTGEAGSPS